MRVKTGGMLKGFKYDRKKFWYTDGVSQTQLFEGDPIPEGFERGRLKFNKPAWNSGLTKETSAILRKKSATFKQNYKKRIWITDGVIEKLVIETASLPQGFVKGRLSCTEIKNLNIDDFKLFYANNTLKECIKKFNISYGQVKTLVKEYNLEDIPTHARHLRKETYTEEWRQEQSMRLKGKNTWSKGRKLSAEHCLKLKEAQAKRTSADIQKSKLKEHNTRIKNGSYKKHMTKAEKIVQEKLLTKFSAEDIIYLYFDSLRYPFECDFYIKSLDLFIEVNIYPSHGGKMFNPNNSADIEKLNMWKQKVAVENKLQYANWIYTWTDLDIRKANYAKNNNLNYISLYNLSDLEEKIDEYL